ncbi:hypothetical protein LX59_02563 [Azomonas agilis]|uniref:Serine aminopeptidase S33 domain-containing protein n=1 Tax=Azomonas agilis TaxID=116849 RepID=A0A562I019_9GAMM|nr:alpha/beta fold hydrolase [Azomonas agilis]TWH64360.1 hypothetical protein LX59_02563 [Azomonas agilis]
MHTQEESVVLDGPCGALEGLYYVAPNASQMVLICHPNPVKGGTMLNKVVSTLQRTARDAGYITLRFNYRGVGSSAGAHDMHMGEVEDADAAVRWLLAKHPSLPLTLMGFSYGGFVAACLAGRLEAEGQPVARQILAAPAVARLEGHPLAQQGALTIIQPDQDEVIVPDRVYQFSAELARPHELLKVAECSHFFHGKLVELKDRVAERL